VGAAPPLLKRSRADGLAIGVFLSPLLADLARAFPQTTIILNHVGGPLGIGPYADKKLLLSFFSPTRARARETKKIKMYVCLASLCLANYSDPPPCGLRL
jgi:predicted TIM-barrel fold metal-dependent hydrolase